MWVVGPVLYAGAGGRHRASSPGGSGVPVHRGDCVNVAALRREHGRMVDVEAPTANSVFLVADRPGSTGTAALRHHPHAVRPAREHPLGFRHHDSDRIAKSRFTFEMGDPKHLGHILKAVRGVQGVFDAYRLTSARSTA